MRRILLFIIPFLFVTSCSQDEKAKEEEIYTFLNICFEDYYKNYDIEISEELRLFEKHLIKEGHLLDSTGYSYKMLLKSLKRNTYFEAPLTFDDFEEAMLYKNPSSLINCASVVFKVDSTSVSNTHFSKVTEDLSNELSTKETVSIQYFFDIYNTQLSEEELQMPYIKQSLQLLLYRWYFKSKNINSK